MTKDDFIRELYKNSSEKFTLKDLTMIVDEISTSWQINA